MCAASDSFSRGTTCYIVYKLEATGTALDGLSYTRTIIGSWTKLRAAIEAVPMQGTATLATKVDFKYDGQIVISGKSVTVLGNGAVLNGGGGFFSVQQGALTLESLTLMEGGAAHGGAINSKASQLTLRYTTLYSNHGGFGCDIYVDGGYVDITGGNFTANGGGESGGAITISVGV
jgi:hypothetical protein